MMMLAVEVAGLALIASIPAEAAALAGAALTGVGLSLMFPATVATTLRRTGPLMPGAAVGTMTSFWDVGLLAAGPLGGLLARQVGYPAAFTAAAVAAGGALAVSVVLHHRGLAFEGGDQAADAGLGDVQSLGGAAEVQFVGEG
jgi:MFS family permease